METVGWLSVRQLVFHHTVLQAHKIIVSGHPKVLAEKLTTDHPYNTRMESAGNIRFGDQFSGQSDLTHSSFCYRAVRYYNSVPVTVKSGTIDTVKRHLKRWTWENIPID